MKNVCFWLYRSKQKGIEEKDEGEGSMRLSSANVLPLCYFQRQYTVVLTQYKLHYSVPIVQLRIT